MDIALPYKPFPKQEKFHESPALYRLFGGAAGPGKSEAILWEGVIQCLEYPGISGVLFRKTYPELEMSLIRNFLLKCPRELYKYNQQQHLVKFINGSTLQFAYAAGANDVFRYQSAEFDFIGVDELTHFEEFFFTYIISRLRTIKEEVTPNFFAATNPGNVGHQFVKARWVDKNCKSRGYNPDEYDFIPARIYDNPILMEIDPGYLQRLENLPDQQRKALLEGSFDVFEGQVFAEFRRELHVAEPMVPKMGFAHFLSFDWGYRAPFACYASALVPSKHEGVDFFRMVTYQEWYGTEKHPSEWAKIISNGKKDAEGNYIIGPALCRDFKKAYADPSMFNIKADGSISIADEIMAAWKRLGKFRVSIKPGSKNRIQRVATVHNWLSIGPDGVPYWIITENCRNLIRTLPILVYDSHRIEDVDTSLEEHAYDSMGYLLSMVKWIDAKPGGVPRPRKIQKYKRALPTDKYGNILSIDTDKFAVSSKKRRGWQYQ